MIETSVMKELKLPLFMSAEGPFKKLVTRKNIFQRRWLMKQERKVKRREERMLSKKMMSLTENIFTSKVLQLNFSLSVSHQFLVNGIIFWQHCLPLCHFLFIFIRLPEKSVPFNGLSANINRGNFKDASLCDKSRLTKGSICASEIIVYQIINMPY